MKKNLKPVNREKNPGLAKLPTAVRNKMGFMKKGGPVDKPKKKKSKSEMMLFKIGRDIMQPKGPKKAAKGGMVKGYKKGGSVSRGQYPVQTKKVKFKGVY
jgi:hypothetical protein